MNVCRHGNTQHNRNLPSMHQRLSEIVSFSVRVSLVRVLFLFYLSTLPTDTVLTFLKTKTSYFHLFILTFNVMEQNPEFSSIVMSGKVHELWCTSRVGSLHSGDLIFCCSFPRMPSDTGHAEQRKPPGSAEETDPYWAQSETGSREHDPDVLQRLVQGNHPNNPVIKPQKSHGYNLSSLCLLDRWMEGKKKNEKIEM